MVSIWKIYGGLIEITLFFRWKKSGLEVNGELFLFPILKLQIDRDDVGFALNVNLFHFCLKRMKQSESKRNNSPLIPSGIELPCI